MTMSASTQASSMAWVLEATVSSAPRKWWSTWRGALEVPVENVDVGVEPDGQRGGGHAGHPGAQDDHFGRLDPGDAADQRPRPAPGRIKWCDPTSGAMRPATSLIGVRSGRELSARRTVS